MDEFFEVDICVDEVVKKEVYDHCVEGKDRSITNNQFKSNFDDLKLETDGIDKPYVHNILFNSDNIANVENNNGKSSNESQPDQSLHPCKQCNYVGSCKANLRRHLRKMHTIMLSCDLCGQKFHSKFFLDKHKNSHLAKGKLNIKMSNEKQKNLKVENPEGNCSGGESDSKLTQKSDLALHIKSEKEEIDKCDQCPTNDDSTSKLGTDVCANKVYKCDECDYSSKCRRVFVHHTKSQHGQEIHACNKCKYQGNCDANLKRHMKKMHSASFTCPECMKEFHNEFFLKKHMSTHKVFACEVCDHEASLKKDLDRHILTHKEVVYHCCHCSFSETSLSVFSQHRLKQHGDKCSCLEGDQGRKKKNSHARSSFACDLCDFRAEFLDSLIEHLRSLHAKTEQCERCDFVTYTKSYLKRHMGTIHRSLFFCIECNFKTRSLDNMTIHTRKNH